jgi:O-antigen/teichoic acid export membrane protein
MNCRSFIAKNQKIFVVVDQAAYSGGSFVATFMAAHVLTVADFGRYAAFTLMLYLFISMSNALVVQPFQVLYPRSGNMSKYLGFVFWFQVAAALLVAVGLGVAGSAGLSLFAINPFYMVAIAWAFLMHDFLRKVFLACEQVFEALLIDVVAAGLQFALLATSMVRSTSLNLEDVLMITAISFGAGALVGICLLKPKSTTTTGWKQFAMDHYTQGRWLFLTAIIQWWVGNFFVVAAGLFLGPVALGAFRLVQSLFGILNLVLQTYENYALPKAVKLLQVSREQSKKYLLSLSLKGIVAFGFVLVGLFIFSEQIILWVGGEKFVPYAYVVKGMAVLYFIIFVGYPVRMAVRMLVMNNVIFIGYAISLVFSLLSFRMLLQEYALWGAIGGLVINQLILIMFWQYNLARKHFLLWK